MKRIKTFWPWEIGYEVQEEDIVVVDRRDYQLMRTVVRKFAAMAEYNATLGTNTAMVKLYRDARAALDAFNAKPRKS